MHLGAPYGLSGCREAEDRGSAQTLVQVGRGEEGVGGQAHSQEAPDQEGAKTTLERKQETQSKTQRSEGGPVCGVSGQLHAPCPPDTAMGPQIFPDLPT